jgi:hypothetical protein
MDPGNPLPPKKRKKSRTGQDRVKCETWLSRSLNASIDGLVQQCENSMTYDVLTRRPDPVFCFLVGRLAAVVGVPARDEGRESPGGNGGLKASSVGELPSSDA